MRWHGLQGGGSACDAGLIFALEQLLAFVELAPGLDRHVSAIHSVCHFFLTLHRSLSSSSR